MFFFPTGGVLYIFLGQMIVFSAHFFNPKNLQQRRDRGLSDRPSAPTEASYILYELAGEAISTMTLTHDWEWHLGVGEW